MRRPRPTRRSAGAARSESHRRGWRGAVRGHGEGEKWASEAERGRIGENARRKRVSSQNSHATHSPTARAAVAAGWKAHLLLLGLNRGIIERERGRGRAGEGAESGRASGAAQVPGGRQLTRSRRDAGRTPAPAGRAFRQYVRRQTCLNKSFGRGGEESEKGGRAER